jgi:hypothetical protein
MPIQCLEHRSLHSSHLQLGGEQVDAYTRQVDAQRTPPHELRAGFVDYPPTDLRSEDMLFQRRQEQGGADQAAGGMLPAQQRLGAQLVTVRHASLRLVVQNPLSTLGRLSHLLLEDTMNLQPVLKDVVKHASPAAAVALGLEKGKVSADKELLRVPSVNGGNREANARCETELVFSDHEALVEGRHQRVGDRLCAHRIAAPWQEHCELVAANASEHGILVEPGRELEADQPEEVIADWMPKSVVDYFEPVQIQQH